MHPFVSYEVALGIVEEVSAVSERRWRLRRGEDSEPKRPPSVDTEMALLVAGGSETWAEAIDIPA